MVRYLIVIAVSISTAVNAEDFKPPTISCVVSPVKIEVRRSTGRVSVDLPASGKMFGEGHYVTTADSFPEGRDYPEPMEPQPFSSGPVQCNESIDAHLDRSVQLYSQVEPGVTKEELFGDKWAVLWTPQEGGSCGQGSIGDRQLTLLTPEKEMWFFTMYWADAASKPNPDTRFLLQANGRSVVVVAGYETGPGGDTKLGGVTREVHKWLGTNNESMITASLLADQAAPLGPVDCSP